MAARTNLPRDVVISDAQGNVLATFPAEGWDIGWSPDSTRVAVWDVVFETIGVYGLDGARQAQLTMPAEHGGSGDWDPVWMPDGTSLMVPNGSRIELPLDGGAPRPLPFPGYASAFSPDGSHVVYAHSAVADGCAVRWIRPPGGVRGLGRCPTWSPTGDQIAFTARGRGPSYMTLQVLDMETGSVTVLTEGERGDYLSVIGFSPQADRILFSKHRGRPRGRAIAVEHRRRRLRRPPRCRRDDPGGVVLALIMRPDRAPSRAGGVHQVAGDRVDVNLLFFVREHHDDDAGILEAQRGGLYPSLCRPVWPKAPDSGPYSERLSQIPNPYSGRSSKSVISSSDAGDTT